MEADGNDSPLTDRATRALSISAMNVYSECAYKFDLQYNQRIRPVRQMSYFAFGSAIDAAVNSLLLGETDYQHKLVEGLFRLREEPTEFLEKDYVGELMDEGQEMVLLDSCRHLGYKGDDIHSLAAALLTKPVESLSENQSRCLAILCHTSLQNKAFLMLDAYRRNVLPYITDVDNVQREIRWTDDKGNKFVGVVDFTAKYNGHDILGDNKTSSNPDRDYGPDSVRLSTQLSAYCPHLQKTHAAYFVMDKNIRLNRVKTCTNCGVINTGRHKTCAETVNQTRCDGDFTETIQPEESIKVVIDESSKEEQAIVQSALTGTAEAIKAGAFPKNLKACRTQYGRKTVLCPYYDFCRNGSMKGLVKK